MGVSSKDIKKVRTTRGELHYYQDWEESEGSIVMQDAKTISRYIEIQNSHPDLDECGVFFAFNEKQFDEGCKHLLEIGKAGDCCVYSHPQINGLHGTKEGILKYIAYYDELGERVSKECDPQEVYFYEYNNHECMIAFNGDEDAIRLVIIYFGKDVANGITRVSACTPI